MYNRNRKKKQKKTMNKFIQIYNLTVAKVNMDVIRLRFCSLCLSYIFVSTVMLLYSYSSRFRYHILYIKDTY